MLITKQLLIIKLRHAVLKIFEQLLSNVLVYFLATFYLFRSRIWTPLPFLERKKLSSADGALPATKEIPYIVVFGIKPWEKKKKTMTESNEANNEATTNVTRSSSSHKRAQEDQSEERKKLKTV